MTWFALLRLFSVCFCRYSNLKKHGKFVPHEQALVEGDLVFLHTYQDVLSFVSIFPTCFFSQCVPDS